MDPETGSRDARLTSGQDTWSARCAETCTSGAAGGPGKPTGSNPDRAPRSDPTGAVRRRAGAVAGRADVGGRAPPRARRDVRRAQPRAGWRPSGCAGRWPSLPLPRAADGRIVLAVDVSPWLRPDAPTSADRLFCHVYGRGRGQSQRIPGWPYSFVAALEPGRTSWTAVLDAVRLGPDRRRDRGDRRPAARPCRAAGAAGQWHAGDPDILIVLDAGYDVTRLAFVLADLPVELLGRLRADRVLCLPGPAATPGPRRPPAAARPGVRPGPPRARWPAPAARDQHRHHPLRHRAAPRPGTGCTRGWTTAAAWADHPGELPIVEGTLIRLQVEHLPGERDPKPVWLWSSRTERHTRGCGPLLAGVPAPLRSRTHLPAAQADPRLDRPEDP